MSFSFYFSIHRRLIPFTPRFHQFVAARFRLSLLTLKVHTSTTQHESETNQPPQSTKEMKMKMKTTTTNNSTFNIDNAAATLLLGAFLALIIATIFSSTKADAKEVSYTAAPQIETIVVTATRLK